MVNLTLAKKLKRLEKTLKGYKRVICAFSGGVDSTLLLYLALKTLKRESVRAVTFVSPTYSRYDLKAVKHLLRFLKANHLFLLTEELKDKDFLSNPPDRCYFCKRSAYQLLRQLFPNWVIIEGTNLSDLKDHRPGRRALWELKIKSPFLLARMEKDDIRTLARRFSLPNYQKPPNPCLASRLPFFRKITEEELMRVERGEEVLRRLGLSFFRLRSEGKTARLETEPEEWRKVLKRRSEILRGLKRLGYSFITLDLEGYRPSGLRWKEG